MTTEIKLPELGENIESAEVLSVLVSSGQSVEKDQPLIELETDKATAEVPAESSGVVKEVLVHEGEEIHVGQTILTLETEDKAAEAPAKKTEPRDAEVSPAKPAKSKSKTAGAEPETEETAPPKPVEPGPESAAATPPPLPAEMPEPVDTSGRAETPGRTETPGPAEASPPTSSIPADDTSPDLPPRAALLGMVAPAAPSIRRLARELGIAIHEVPGTGPGGRISEDDVKTFAKSRITMARQSPAPAGRSTPAAPGAVSIPELPDFSRWGKVERERASKVRRITAQNLSLSWNAIPHVTQFDRADITELEQRRKTFGKNVEQAGGKLTVTAIAVKVLASALKVFPRFNSSYDARTEEIVYKKYVNIGIAVDTDHGLLVPVLHNVDRKNITEIAVELGDLARRTRDRKVAVDELQGANINLSNLGGLGTTYFSPIIAWPQVAVLGLGKATFEAVYENDTFVPRLILPLAVSYDHRVIDGADAARFLRWIAAALEQPLLIALEG